MKCEQLGLFGDTKHPAANHANRGKWLEDMCDWTHAIYRREGLARVDRNYPAAQRLNRDGFARVTGKGVCDYSGAVRGGRMVAFDAKTCARKSVPLDTLREHQAEHLRDVDKLGGVAFVLVAFGMDRVYAVPARVWIEQAEAAGLHAWHIRADGERTARASLREADMPDEWAVRVDGRGADWIQTVTREDWGCR